MFTPSLNVFTLQLTSNKSDPQIPHNENEAGAEQFPEVGQLKLDIHSQTKLPDVCVIDAEIGTSNILGRHCLG